MHCRRRNKRRLVRYLAAITVQSAARAASARARCSTLRASRLHRWMHRVTALYADASGFGGDESVYAPSPAAVELLRDDSTPPPPPPPTGSPPVTSSQQYAANGAPPRKGGLSNRSGTSRGGRALAEALAPRMGRPPPGCPAALDVDWGDWGVGLRLLFPPSPPVG